MDLVGVVLCGRRSRGVLLHVTSNHQSSIGTHKLNLFSSVDNHQIAVNDAAGSSVRRQTAGAIRLHRIGAGESYGKNRAPVIRGGRPRKVSLAIKDEMHRLREGHKGPDGNVIGIAGTVDQTRGACSISATQDRGCANLGVSVKLNCRAAVQSRETGDHE